jgi:hypothetical protein
MIDGLLADPAAAKADNKGKSRPASEPDEPDAAAEASY